MNCHAAKLALIGTDALFHGYLMMMIGRLVTLMRISRGNVGRILVLHFHGKNGSGDMREFPPPSLSRANAKKGRRGVANAVHISAVSGGERPRLQPTGKTRACAATLQVYPVLVSHVLWGHLE